MKEIDSLDEFWRHIRIEAHNGFVFVWSPSKLKLAPHLARLFAEALVTKGHEAGVQIAEKAMPNE